MVEVDLEVQEADLVLVDDQEVGEVDLVDLEREVQDLDEKERRDHQDLVAKDQKEHRDRLMEIVLLKEHQDLAAKEHLDLVLQEMKEVVLDEIEIVHQQAEKLDHQDLVGKELKEVVVHHEIDEVDLVVKEHQDFEEEIGHEIGLRDRQVIVFQEKEHEVVLRDHLQNHSCKILSQLLNQREVIIEEESKKL